MWRDTNHSLDNDVKLFYTVHLIFSHLLIIHSTFNYFLIIFLKKYYNIQVNKIII